ncbi:pimeloyl-ACP methyl esterase BioG family protein [Brevundimonas sp.]|uniref:pimeloyl-ACP methyl esterase BioG family protein n=1 Tax=Brevundimonas sp. TaxID=1871086 RepID=UPI0028A7597E|nr:pimeloyl-ACP methyl esterase BioG family protein [Brevundimonas sp.]
MKAQWLQRDDADELIVVFGGWALGAAPFAHLGGSTDVLLFSDYRALDFDAEPFAPYARRNLIGYSFGVAAACHALASTELKFDRKVAVCGSLHPSDERFGIPPERVRQTADNLSETSLRQFARRAGSPLPGDCYIPALQAELLAVIARGCAPDPEFDRVWLARGDRIFPPENLEAAWRDQADRVRWLETGHNPFAAFTDWRDLLA